MNIAPGSRLGPYEILSPIGAGGMGQVWKGLDTRLDRIVAIKIAAADFTERFATEARAIAKLNHPHICTLYDVGPDYLVMEYVEGAEIKGPLPPDRALKLALQLAGALEAAHRKGITHRDLKPANILITKSGIKVLDFGLAKIELTKEEAQDAVTMARPMTREGSIMGTLQYMAPEQLQAKPIDARADIFAFGCVLYEMLTGKRAFDGANTASVIAAIMERAAPSVADVAPASLDWVLRRCLEKDPDERWQTARDLRAALERCTESGTVSQEARLSPRVPALAWIAGALAIAFGAVSFLHFREKPAEAPITRLSVEPPAKTRFSASSGSPPAISPDGRQIVFEAISADGQRQLWLRPLDSLTAQPLTGTGGGSFPFWSPDNKSIGFFAAGKLKKMDASGGPATTLADAPTPRGGTWNQAGVIVFAPSPYSGLMQIPASGGTTHPATNSNDKAASTRFPWFLPDGTHFLYLFGRVAGGQQTVRIGSVASPTEDLALPEAADSFAIFSKGCLLFIRGNTLVARPFDAKGLKFTGEAVPVAEQVQISNSVLDLGEFSGSPKGDLVYQGGLSNLSLTSLDRAGKHLGTLGDAAQFGDVHFSPDGKTVAVTVRDASANNMDVWLYDVSRGLRTRFTFDPAIDGSPVWSPEGRMIVFRSSRKGQFDIYRKPADGSRNEELLYADNLLKAPTSFSPDSKYLAYWTQGDPRTGYDIWILPDPLGTPGAAKPYPFLRTEFAEANAQFSPDGHWMAYNSNESGKNEVYVTPFPDPGGKRQVSTAGGTAPRWRADGKELFYVAPDSRLMAAEVEAKGGAFEVRKVEPLFGPLLTNNNTAFYDVSADGQRFLALVPPEGEVAEPLTVVLNWTPGLKK